MANSSADSALGVLGVDLDRVDTSALHEQGARIDTQNGRAVYAKAIASTGVGSLVLVAPSSAGAAVSVQATLVSTANVNSAPGFLAFSNASIAAASYGWFYTEGNRDVRVKVAAAAAPLVPLYTTGTGGVLDDATVSTGRIQGVRILEAASAGGGSAQPAVFGPIVNARTYVA